MCTGAQGEPTSILGRLARGTQRQFDAKSGDTIVLSSKTIPGNEEAVFSTINELFRRGANVIYEEIMPVHVSGHGSQEDIKLLIHLVKPKYFIPAYGELRHLKQASILAQQTGIPEKHVLLVENGNIINVKKGKIKLNGQVSYETIFVDGSWVGDLGPDEMRDRTQLSTGRHRSGACQHKRAERRDPRQTRDHQPRFCSPAGSGRHPLAP